MNSTELKLKIEQQTENWSFTKYNLMRIGTLVRLIDETQNHAETCPQCKEYHEHLPNMVDQILQLEDSYVRSDYEKRFNEMRTHFHKYHGYYAPSHYSARFSLIGISTFLLASAILSYTSHQSIIVDYLLFGGAAGLMIGYLIGSMRDLKIRKAEKLI